MRLEREGQVGIIYIDTETNNAINFEFFRESHQLMDEVEQDPAIRALVVTSTNKSMFSPGVDLPSVLGLSPEEMRRFIVETTGLIRRKFLFPKPEVYALNGHTIAGGFMVAITGDYRLMADGPFKLGLMEIDIGLAAHIGTVEMIKYVFGGRLADRILMSGETYSPEEALRLGLIDEVTAPDALMQKALAKAEQLGSKPPSGYRILKRYLHQAVAERMKALDEDHYDELVDQWFNPEVQEKLTATVERMTARKAAAAGS